MTYFDFCCTGSNPTRPIYGCNAVTWPLVYDESVSIVQQIAYIMGAINEQHLEIDGLMTDAEFAEWLKQYETDRDNDGKAANTYTDEQVKNAVNYLHWLIDQLAMSGITWDVTQGVFTDTVTAMRNLYRWDSVHAITVKQLADNVETVAALAASTLNVRGLATWSYELVADWSEPDGIRYVEPPAPEPGQVRELLNRDIIGGVVDEHGYFLASAPTFARGLKVDDVKNGVVDEKTNRMRKGEN